MKTWTVNDPRIAPSRLTLTDRAARWATRRVGLYSRSVSDVARELGCDWHTVNEAVMAFGAALVDHPGRVGPARALGLDETLFARKGQHRRLHWSTSIVDVRDGVLLDIVEGRDSEPVIEWWSCPGLTDTTCKGRGTLEVSVNHANVEEAGVAGEEATTTMNRRTRRPSAVLTRPRPELEHAPLLNRSARASCGQCRTVPLLTTSLWP